MIQGNNELDEAMRDEYRAHALEELERAEQVVLDCESEKLQEIIRKIQLIIHSIKGSSGTYDFNFASRVCHSLEDFLNSEEHSKQNSQIMDTILSYIDLLKEYFKVITSDSDDTINKFRQRLESLSFAKNSVDYRVLIVELSKTLSSACERILRNIGIRVAVVKDGYEALGRLLKEEFDCLITSKRVATINGIQLIQSLNLLDGPNKDILKVLITTDRKLEFEELKCQMFIKNQQLLTNLESFFEKKVNALEEKNLDSYQEVTKKQTKPLKKILCVDDDKLLQRVIKISLKAIPDVNIECCTSPSESLSKLRDYTPDLLILDVMMEEMSGIELSQQIKSKHPNIPFVFLTGTTKPKEIEALFAHGAIAVISKPFKPKSLYNQVLSAWAKAQ